MSSSIETLRLEDIESFEPAANWKWSSGNATSEEYAILDQMRDSKTEFD
jgi:hypothetical protein